MSNPQFPEATSLASPSGDKTVDGEINLASFEQSFHPEFEDQPSPSVSRYRTRAARPLSILSNVSELSEVDLDSTPAERRKRSQQATKRRLMASDGHSYERLDQDPDPEEEHSRESLNISHPNSSPEVSETSRRNSFRTPMNIRAASDYPTNTAIANRVQAIQLPQTAVKELSQWKDNNASPEGGKGAKLSLKEQSAMVDKLKKDNFGLQLKIYYLSQLLEKRSDESVNEMQQENVDLKIAIVEMKRALKDYKSRIDELENRQCEKKHVEDDEELERRESLHSELLRANALLEARTREKSALYAELEALKLSLRSDNGNEIDHQECELALDELRDKICEVKLASQDRIHEVEQAYEEMTQEQRLSGEAARTLAELAEELDHLREDKQEMERYITKFEESYEQLKRDAEYEVDRLEDELDIKDQVLVELKDELEKVVSDNISLEESLQSKNLRIADLRKRLEEAAESDTIFRNQLDGLRDQKADVSERLTRLSVQYESLERELQFLREHEKELTQNISVKEEKIRSLEQCILDKEEKWRLTEAAMKKQHTEDFDMEFQHTIEDKNVELEKARAELSTLRRKLDGMEWDTQNELEKTLREILQDDSSSRNGLVEKLLLLRKDFDIVSSDFERLQHNFADKEQTLKKTDEALEAMATETKRLAERLERERQLRKQTQSQLQQVEQSVIAERKSSVDRSLRLADLEKARSKENRALTILESQYREHVQERNTLLSQVFERLREVVGSENLRDANVLPSMNLKLFSSNLWTAIKCVEFAIRTFQTKCKDIERDLVRDYQYVVLFLTNLRNLEHALENRTRRIQRLESLARTGAGASNDLARQITSLKMENRHLKSEYHLHLQKCNGSNQRASTPSPGSIDRRWHLRLKELEGRLKASEEARARDRRGAKERLEESQKVIEDLQRPNTTSTEVSEGKTRGTIVSADSFHRNRSGSREGIFSRGKSSTCSTPVDEAKDSNTLI